MDAIGTYFEPPEDSHLAVAAAIASGVGDVGMGIEAAARAFGLDFVPIVAEDYFLVCMKHALEHPAVLALRKVLHSPRWVQALDSGAINPRTNIQPETQVRLRDQDIIISKFGSMPAVKFPHRQHTLWLDCSNCHEHLFKSKAGANAFSMQAILDGEQCGLCHGAVSFPLTECNRCHSVSNASLRAGGVK